MASLLEGLPDGSLDTAALGAAGLLEMVTADGTVRDHWRGVHDAVAGMAPSEIRRLRREVDHLLREDGVTYHVPGTGERRLWQLDPLPMVIAAEEWARVEAGVVQRAELLNLVLVDVYGPRTLLREGLLPPELVHGHPAFLRPLQGVRLPGRQQLFTYAADLGRAAGGELVLLGDRTQAPSGAAYALENRLITSRVLGRLHRTSGVQRLAPYFRALRRGLQQVAPEGVDMPRTVLLTPGSRNETAFEHAFLAARLGLSLVEGSDLRVRDGRVWLRTLGHPEQVDVIVRRLDETWCDPLELRPESLIGVPGLVEAVRTGAVSVVNSLGSGVLENPALQAFLPAIARHLLGQPLRLRAVDTIWLGAASDRDEVLSDIGGWVFKPVARDDDRGTVVGAELDARQRTALRARILAGPRGWVAQAPVSQALAPVLDAGRVTHRRTVLRTFAVADGDTYAVMPGGLTRVATGDGLIIANHKGAWSKDTWVLGQGEEPVAGFWREGIPSVALPPDATMPSRAGQNLYWLGRYAERAECVARLLREIEARRTEFADSATPAGLACVTALMQALTHVTTTYPGFVGAGSAARLADPEPELAMIAGDQSRPGTLAHAITNLLEAVDAVRDQLSGDTWLVVVDLQQRLSDSDASLGDGTLSASQIARILHGLLSIQGLAAENMFRDHGWRFMDAGRRTERGLQVLALLRATATHVREEGAEGLVAESVLRVAESIITYRRRYRSTAQVSTLLDLLLLEPDNPRSLSYQFDRLAEDLVLLPDHPGPGRVTPVERPVLEASTALRVADTSHLADAHDGGVRTALDDFLSHLYGLMVRTAEELDRTHFTHLMPQRTLSADTEGSAA